MADKLEPISTRKYYSVWASGDIDGNGAARLFSGEYAECIMFVARKDWKTRSTPGAMFGCYMVDDKGQDYHFVAGGKDYKPLPVELGR